MPLGDLHPAGLAGLRYRDRQHQHAMVEFGGQVVRIEVVTQEQLTTELPLRPLVDDDLVALLAQRPAEGGDLYDVSFHRHIQVPRGDAWQNGGEEVVVSTA